MEIITTASSRDKGRDTGSKELLRAYLVGIKYPDVTKQTAENLLDELESLADTMGLETLGREIVPLKRQNSAFLVGSGKAQEISLAADDEEADCIIFDDDLSPSQQRNWERLTGLAVIDRHEVILDIFASRASTHEAVLQVALARMEYSLPRLTRAWTHLSRQRGGAKGTKGEGESQLEMDRRIVLKKIAQIKKELIKVKNHRATQRKKRASVPIPTASIVGYTNAGKSSLLNAFTNAGVLTEDKLFATLDPTTRKVDLPGAKELLLTDTVGFIRKLPHDLIDAFSSTLEEITLSDFIIQVIDAGSDEIKDHMENTAAVLRDIGAGEKPVLKVFNKIDTITEESRLQFLKLAYPEALFISVKTSAGLSKLLERLDEMVRSEYTTISVVLPTDRGDLFSLLHREGVILSTKYVDNVIEIEVQVTEKTKNIITPFISPSVNGRE